MSHQKKNPRSPVINGNHYLSYASVRHAASVSGTRHSRRNSLATPKKTLLEIDRLYMPCNACEKKEASSTKAGSHIVCLPSFPEVNAVQPRAAVGRSVYTRDTVPENRRKLYLTYVHNPNTHTTPVLRHFNWPLYEK